MTGGPGKDKICCGVRCGKIDARGPTSERVARPTNFDEKAMRWTSQLSQAGCGQGCSLVLVRPGTSVPDSPLPAAKPDFLVRRLTKPRRAQYCVVTS